MGDFLRDQPGQAGPWMGFAAALGRRRPGVFSLLFVRLGRGPKFHQTGLADPHRGVVAPALAEGKPLLIGRRGKDRVNGFQHHRG